MRRLTAQWVRKGVRTALRRGYRSEDKRFRFADATTRVMAPSSSTSSETITLNVRANSDIAPQAIRSSALALPWARADRRVSSQGDQTDRRIQTPGWSYPFPIRAATAWFVRSPWVRGRRAERRDRPCHRRIPSRAARCRDRIPKRSAGRRRASRSRIDLIRPTMRHCRTRTGLEKCAPKRVR